MKQVLLAIDIGTSGAKLLLWDRGTGRSWSETASYPTQTPNPGWAQQDPSAWWKAVCDTLPALFSSSGVSPADVAAVGVDGISWSPVLLDEKGGVLCDSPLWYDTRSGQECREITETLGEEQAFLTGGNPVQPYYTLPKLLWIRRHLPDVFRRVKTVLSVNGYIVYRLTGALTLDLSQAYGYCFFDMGSGSWNTAMAEKLGLDASVLPPLCESTAVAGTVTREAAALTGLAEGTPVAAGGLDAACGAVGAGVIAPGRTHEQSGSAGGMSICDTAYHPVKGLILSRHVVPGIWLLQGGTVGGGNLIRWLRDDILHRTGNDVMNEMTREAQAVPAGSEGLTFLPYMSGERSPIWNPQARGVFFGLNYGTGAGHLTRAVMEGAAYALRHNLEYAAESGAEIGLMHCVGGAAFNPLWMQIKADVTGYPFSAVSVKDATAMGCALVAGVGCGLIRDFAEGCEGLAEYGRPYEPDAAKKALYDRGYEQYLNLYAHLKDMMC